MLTENRDSYEEADDKFEIKIIFYGSNSTNPVKSFPNYLRDVKLQLKLEKTSPC